MASPASQYSYLHARVSVLAERLLPASQLELLIECGPEQKSAILQSAGVENIDLETTDGPATLEQMLVNVLVTDFMVLSRALSGVSRELLIYWARRFELSNLKAIIRGKMAEQTAATIREQLIDIGSFATLPLDNLLRTDDVAELLRQLEATPYGDIARQARRIYEENQDLFALDAAVDRRYLAGLNRRANGLEANDRRVLRRLIGAIFDRFNLVWLLRYRFAYNLTPAETYYLLIPGGYQLNGTQLQTLAQHDSFEQVIANLPSPLSGFLGAATSTTIVDRILEARVCAVAESILRRTAFNLARAFAYLVLRRKDLIQIQAVLKGRYLQMSPDAIRFALWPPVELSQGTEDQQAAAAGG